ncbi:MAG: hypothetical protein EOO77_44610, partial [Oxalobacteraceae bacterium]
MACRYTCRPSAAALQSDPKISRVNSFSFASSSSGAARLATITSHIKRIRRKFQALDPAFDEVDTVHGAGY